jgi:hypothetical protein
MNSLVECFKSIREILGESRESIEVVRRVQNHREFWKPRKVKVILLAESHVYTTKEESNIQLNLKLIGLPNYPRNYIRLVYCLGYGENNLVTDKIYDNAGTPQFWRIFFSCCHNVQSNLDFEPILKRTTSFQDRLVNKIILLKQLRDMGIWLIDASIVSLYRNPLVNNPRTKRRIISVCWNDYIGSLLNSLKPKHIICIGKGIGKVLMHDVRHLGVPFTIISQPQARLKSEEHLQNYRRYYEICKKNCK